MTHNPGFLTWDQMTTEWARWAADVAQRALDKQENASRGEDPITAGYDDQDGLTETGITQIAREPGGGPGRRGGDGKPVRALDGQQRGHAAQLGQQAA